VFTNLILPILYWIYEIAIHCRAFIVDLPSELVFTEQILQILFWIYEIAFHSTGIGFTHITFVKYILFLFWRGIGLFIVCFTVWENA
jgi:hypothetical protein